MIIYGPIEIAGLEELSADPVTNLWQGRIYFNTTNDTIRYYDGADFRQAVSIDQAQVITNKDIDGGTASNTTRITVPQDTLVNLTALARKEGTIVYANDLNALFIDNGGALIELAASASAGLITTDLSVGNVTVSSGTTLFHSQLTIDTGDTYTVNGSLVGIGTLTVDGTLTIAGSGRVIYV